MDNTYKNIEKYNPNKKRKILTVFDDMIADILNNRKLNPTLTKLFIRGRKRLILLYQKILGKKLYAVFHYENYKQTRTSTDCI